jgi:hypothetical protein
LGGEVCAAGPIRARAPGYLSTGRLAGLVAATVAVVAVLGMLDPFTALSDRLTGGGATERMQPIRTDRAHADLSHGEDLLGTLSTAPLPAPGRRRILFLGNSQQYTSSLPRGAQIVPDHEVPIASDLFAGTVERRAPGGYDVYNASAPNQTPVEGLWQAIYWFRVASPPPAVLVVQSSFDMYRKTGIRPSFQELLEDPRFAAALHDFTRPDAPWASEIAAAERDHDERKKEIAARKEERWTPESGLRAALEHVPLYRERESRKAAFLTDLYLLRVLGLGISPTTRRHILGQALTQNFAALTDLLRLARASGARVLVYNAPVNPDVTMFYEDEYLAYVDRLRSLAAAESAAFADLAAAVPRGMWGYWIDGPDPIHFSEGGHVLVAARLDEAFGPLLAER